MTGLRIRRAIGLAYDRLSPLEKVMLRITGRVQIPLSEIELRAMRSQGSGGQSVNKVSTAIHLFFDISASSLPPRVKERLLSLGDRRITEEGVVVIKSQESRSQEANREAALDRLRQLIERGLSVPKKRRATKPTKGSQTKRLKSKSLRSRTKSLRGRPGADD